MSTTAIDPVDALLDRVRLRLVFHVKLGETPSPGWVFVVRGTGDLRLPSIEIVPWEIALYAANLPLSALRRALDIPLPAERCLRCLVIPVAPAAPVVVDLKYDSPELR